MYRYLSVTIVAFCLLSGCTFAASKKELPDASFFATSLENTKDRLVRLSVASCRQKSCQVMVQYCRGKNLRNELPLPWPASSQDVLKVDSNRWYGAGDPLSRITYPTWAIGDSEHDAMVVSVQTVQLSQRVFGLLVHQTAGFEHIRRHHELFLTTRGVLKSVWKQTEAQGPTWSNVVIPPGAGELIYIEGFQTGDGSHADNVRVQYFVWQEENGRLVKSTQRKAPLFLIWVYPLHNVKAARNFILANTGCFGSDYMVLKKQNDASDEFIIGAITSDKDLANKHLEQLSQCIQGKQIEISQYK